MNFIHNSGLCSCNNALCKNLSLKTFGSSDIGFPNSNITSFAVFTSNSKGVDTKTTSCVSA